MHWAKATLLLEQGNTENTGLKMQHLHNAAMLSWKPKGTRKTWNQKTVTSSLVALLRITVVPACLASRAKAQVYRDPKEQVSVASGLGCQVPHLQGSSHCAPPLEVLSEDGLQIWSNFSYIPPASFNNTKTWVQHTLTVSKLWKYLLSVFMFNSLPARMVKIFIICLISN